MNKFLYWLILWLLLISDAHAADFNVNDTSNATFAGIAATSGYKNTPAWIGISVGADGADSTVTIKCGTTTKIGPLYFAANTTGKIDIEKHTKEGHLFQCAENEALNFTKSAAGNDVTVFGQYQLLK